MAGVKGTVQGIGIITGVIVALGSVYLMIPVWYLDEDQDGFGDYRVSWRLPWKPEGYVAPREDGFDCYDQNAKAFPGSRKYQSKHRGDDSFDYDCNGSSDREYAQLGECSDSGNTASPEGWHGSIPDCGKSGRWLDDCDRRVSFRRGLHVVSETTPRTQRCR